MAKNSGLDVVLSLFDESFLKKERLQFERSIHGEKQDNNSKCRTSLALSLSTGLVIDRLIVMLSPTSSVLTNRVSFPRVIPINGHARFGC